MYINAVYMLRKGRDIKISFSQTYDKNISNVYNTICKIMSN